jgi:hypothetical protein
MISQEFSENLEEEFAEKCRKALEKSWGVNVPMPNCLNNKKLR